MQMAAGYTISTATSSRRWRARARRPGSSPARRSGTSAFGFNLVEIGPGGQIPEHDEAESGQVELYVILEGDAVLRIEGEEHPAPAGTFASIEPPASRTILNRSEAPVTALLIGVHPEGGYRADVLGLSGHSRRPAELASRTSRPIMRRLVNPSRARSEKARKPGGQHAEVPVSSLGASVERYSPERPYKPLVSPPSVEDKDACAIYASVRKDATPSHEPIELAIPALQKMLHRAGNVDGEGDGCGLLLDLPRKIWAEEVRSGGHDPSLTLDDAFAVAHVFIERSQDPEKIQHDARELLAQAGFRVLAERVGVVDSPALGPTAREEEPIFWQLAGLVPDAGRRDPILFELLIELEQRLGVHVPSFSATTCVYKVMGAPKVLGEYYPDLRDERFETIGCFGHNRYSTNTWPSFKRVQPFSALGHNGEINTIEQLRQEARMLAVPIQPGSSDSQDLNRTIDTLVSREGLSLAEAMEMIVPPIVEEIRSPARGPARLLHVPAPGDGPVRAGPGRADRAPRRRMRLLRRRARPAPALAGRDRRRLRLQLRARRGLGRRDGRRAEAARPRREGAGPDRPRRASARPCTRTTRCCGSSATPGCAATAPSEVARYDRALETGGPLEGDDVPGYSEAGPEEPVKVADRILAGFGWQRDDVKLVQQMATNGAEPIGSLGYDGPLAALSPERQNLADYFKETVAVVTNPAIDREREVEHFSTRALFGRRPSLDAAQRGHGHDRNLLPGDPRRPPRPRAALRQDLPQDRPRAPHLPARGPLGGVPRPRRRGRHLTAGVRDDRGRDRTDQTGSGEEGPRRRPSCWSSPTAPSTTPSAATSTPISPPRRSTRR